MKPAIRYVEARFNHGRWILKSDAFQGGEGRSLRSKQAFSEQSFCEALQ